MPVPVAELSGARTGVLCRPNDPTGEVREVVPGEHWLILDEALAGFLPEGEEDRISDHPRVIHIRSFSKAHALAGLRIGYAIVPDGGPDLAPVLGVGAPALAAARWAVDNGAESARRRRDRAGAQRARLARVRRHSRLRSLRVAGRARGRGTGRAAHLRRPWRRVGRGGAHPHHRARRRRDRPVDRGAARPA